MKAALDFKRKRLIGVVHLKPLPGAPRFCGDLEAIIDAAVADARAYQAGGADAIFIENFGDVPFTKGAVGPETVAAMAATGCAVRKAVRIPIGFNVLRNDAISALALCAACGGSFIRVNVHCGLMLTDQGIIEGNAFETLRYRHRICPNVMIFADVLVKHAVPPASLTIEQAGRDTLERGLADALIVSGEGTGRPASLTQVGSLRLASPQSIILIGSGITAANVSGYLSHADGVIVGTSLKEGRRVEKAVSSVRVRELRKKIILRN
jgi:membrane complex biogenesis BtpA family protein